MLNTTSSTIEIDFSAPQPYKYLAGQLRSQNKRRGWESFALAPTENDPSAFPNACAPIAGVIDHFRRQHKIDIECTWEGSGTYLDRTGTATPFVVREHFESALLAHPLDKVWKFNSPEEVNAYVNAICKEMRESVDTQEGYLTGIEWCLNESMDNVLQHSESEYGYVMGQIIESQKRLSICIFDNGRGIYNSLLGTKHNPTSPLDAITKALQERVTRDESVGQGNGMWGLSEIVQENAGSFRVVSNGATCFHANGITKTFASGGMQYDSENLGTTLIDFQLDYSKKIDVAKALHGHEPVKLWLENRENITGDHVIKLSEESSGTGTRKAGERMRHLAINILREGQKKVVFDFDKVNVISSSYADELFGKLVREIGFSQFLNCFQMINTTSLQRNVIDRSVQQRMAQMYYDPSISDDADHE